ncbi:hypothetical protein M427DRAFT_245495 [Gonapodya prolifera JEL478]|uniref:TATA element modulatory factor 1 TATA binding domain-containing protein n=1 Tax=Gonapodya prolifera (strain JEL478) TaxID=1344416 RepID=A0A139ALY1_GONPJ|nr:hypothetical protein M427DRAFT_245495 [Gonapodya prolifera JEL478]|eukprot:KXS17769.1 hypothetical protein M427DRAFT_245495 [Gonapodya prolifera JEL478]
MSFFSSLTQTFGGSGEGGGGDAFLGKILNAASNLEKSIDKVLDIRGTGDTQDSGAKPSQSQPHQTSPLPFIVGDDFISWSNPSPSPSPSLALPANPPPTPASPLFDIASSFSSSVRSAGLAGVGSWASNLTSPSQLSQSQPPPSSTLNKHISQSTPPSAPVSRPPSPSSSPFTSRTAPPPRSPTTTTTTHSTISPLASSSHPAPSPAPLTGSTWTVASSDGSLALGARTPPRSSESDDKPTETSSDPATSCDTATTSHPDLSAVDSLPAPNPTAPVRDTESPTADDQDRNGPGALSDDAPDEPDHAPHHTIAHESHAADRDGQEAYRNDTPAPVRTAGDGDGHPPPVELGDEADPGRRRSQEEHSDVVHQQDRPEPATAGLGGFMASQWTIGDSEGGGEGGEGLEVDGGPGSGFGVESEPSRTRTRARAGADPGAGEVTDERHKDDTVDGLGNGVAASEDAPAPIKQQQEPAVKPTEEVDREGSERKESQSDRDEGQDAAGGGALEQVAGGDSHGREGGGDAEGRWTPALQDEPPATTHELTVHVDSHDPPRAQSPEAPEAVPPGTPDFATLLHIVSSRERQLMTATSDNALLRSSLDSARTDVARLEAQVAHLTALIAQQQPATSEADVALLRDQLAAKTAEAEALLSEGQALSQREVRATGAARKAREEAKEAEKRAEAAKREVEQARKEGEEARERAEKAEREGRRLADSLKTLTEQSSAHTKQILRLESDLVVVREEKRSVEIQVERAWAELSDARRVAAQVEGDKVREEIEAKTKLAAELQEKLDKAQRDAATAESMVRREVAELKAALERREDEWGAKEDMLRKDIASLQSRLRTSDTRLEELAASVHEATRPLLRQIDGLQAQQAAAQGAWEATERALVDRVREAESERARAEERERAVREREGEMATRVASLEAQLSTERQGTARLSADLDAERRRASALERKAADLAARLATLEVSYARELDEARENYHQNLRQQLKEAEQTWERRRKEEERERERERARGVGAASVSGDRRSSERNKLRLDIVQRGGGVSGKSSPQESMFSADAGSNGHFASAGSLEGSPLGSFASPVTGVNQALVVEKLSSAVKVLEGQVGSLQAQLQMATRTRDELAGELVKATTENEKMKQEVGKSELVRKELVELKSRHDAALVLLGEKTETVEELKADIADMKVAFREQIETLLAAQGRSGQ